jgi:hypothetical protein
MTDDPRREHRIDWPPATMHRHPSTIATPLAALGCVFTSMVMGFLSLYGLYALVSR